MAATSPFQLTRVVRLAKGVEVLVVEVVRMMSVVVLVVEVLVLLAVLLVLMEVLISILAILIVATKHRVLITIGIIIEKVAKIKVHTSSLDVGLCSSPRAVASEMSPAKKVIIRIRKQIIKVEEASIAELEPVLLMLVMMMLLLMVLVVLSVVLEVFIKSFEELIKVEVGLEVWTALWTTSACIALRSFCTEHVILLPLLLVRQYFICCETENTIVLGPSIIRFNLC